MKKIFAIIIILLLVGCSSKTTYKTISTEETFNEITKTKIVDVRSEAEYNSGHIESSVNIPLDKLETINYKILNGVERNVNAGKLENSLEELSMLQRAKDILQECADEIYEENLEESDVEEEE